MYGTAGTVSVTEVLKNYFDSMLFCFEDIQQLRLFDIIQSSIRPLKMVLLLFGIREIVSVSLLMLSAKKGTTGIIFLKRLWYDAVLYQELNTGIPILKASTFFRRSTFVGSKPALIPLGYRGGFCDHHY